MEFNKVIRGAKRACNDEESVYAILDAGFLCHVAFQHQGQTMMIPTAYGRKEDALYMHGSTKNFMFQQILDGQTLCISVTHLDGIVLARSLFHTGVNYRSTVLFGKAILVETEEERMEGMKIITENVIKGRWDEVYVGTEQQLNATMVVKFTIDKASVKMRAGLPLGDEELQQGIWSGTIPIVMKALEPIQDTKFGESHEITESVQRYYDQNK